MWKLTLCYDNLRSNMVKWFYSNLEEAMVFHYIFQKETSPNHHIGVLFTPNLIWQIIA
jgi:hypothetical protein